MCVWFFLVFGKVGQMTIIGEGMGIQNGMGLLCRSATDTLETFVGSAYQPNMTLLTFFNAVKPDNTYKQPVFCLWDIRSCSKLARVLFARNNLG